MPLGKYGVYDKTITILLSTISDSMKWLHHSGDERIGDIMKIVYYPHKGENRGKEGKKWKSGIIWGADFMLDNIRKIATEHEIVPCYDLNWGNVQDADVIWFHNIATTAFYNLPLLKISPISQWKKKKNRPIIIGGVRGLVGFERSKNILHYFDAIHTGSIELLNKTISYNNYSYVLYPGVDTNLFKTFNIKKDNFIVGWAGDKNKKMKNYEIITELGYPYKVASKDNYIPHEEMPNFYNNISVYTHFSSHEGGNRTVLEACACGLPVISTDTGATNQFIDKDWIIPYRDDYDYLKNEFKHKLRIMENDPELAIEIGLRNRNRSLQYDWKIITKKWNEIIHETYLRVKG
jgi:glycosyltransferase involved in cell wall biosynthesis